MWAGVELPVCRAALVRFDCIEASSEQASQVAEKSELREVMES